MYRPRFSRVMIAVAILWALSGCANRMIDQPRYDPYEASSQFADGASARPLVPHTVARGSLKGSVAYRSGMDNGQPVAEIPTPVTSEVVARGRERFDIYCSPCHGLTGEGNGIVVQRGFPTPPSFHTDRLRSAPAGHYFDVITNGFGVMYSYASRVPIDDRWAIIAYIRALQLSQNAATSSLPESDVEQLPQ